MAQLGNTTKFYIRSIITGDYVRFGWLGCETANSLNRTAEALECSDKSDVWARYIAGKRGATIEATVYADNTDDQQVELLDRLSAGTKVWVLIGQMTPHQTANSSDTIDEGDLVRGVITGISDTNDFGAVATRTFNLTVDDEVTHTDPAE